MPYLFCALGREIGATSQVMKDYLGKMNSGEGTGNIFPAKRNVVVIIAHETYLTLNSTD